MMLHLADIAVHPGRRAESIFIDVGIRIQTEQAELGWLMEETVKIGLDVVPMSYPPSGVRAYVQALIEAFRSRDSSIDLVPIAPLSGLTRSTNRLSRLAWDLHGIAESVKTARMDLLHMTRFAAPRAVDRPFVVTVHDLIPLQLPEYQASLPSRIQSQLARRTVSQATRIIVPSRYVAGDVTRMLGVPPERVDVIPMGVSLPNNPIPPALLSAPYVLHAGGFDVRKNLSALIDAFGLAATALGPEWRLVLLGAPHTGNAAVYPPLGPIIEQAGLRDRVVLTGRVSDLEKHALYRHATIAVAPSISEGFGLPILEAMAHGVPVIASNRTSHPEVAGNAALLVEPDVESIAAALARLAGDADLRSKLSRLGKERAAEFPWSRTAALTEETYRKALDR
jgi:glycosyltransferase involved in cell wall biosynthesis